MAFVKTWTILGVGDEVAIRRTKIDFLNLFRRV
jgi:hypothetical protein